MTERLPTGAGTRTAKSAGALGLFPTGSLPRGWPPGNASRRPRHAGAILVVVLLCITLAAGLSTQSLQTALTARHVDRQYVNRAQARWLAEAGLERAAARLSLDPDYQGETWNVAAQELTGSGTGVVLISVEEPEGALVRVTAQADFPADSSRRTRRTLMRTISLGETNQADGGAE